MIASGGGHRQSGSLLFRFFRPSVLLQDFNEVPIGVSKRNDESETVIGRSVGLNTARGEALGNGLHARRAEHDDRTLAISRRNTDEPCARMDGKMHAADIATEVKRDSMVFLVFQRQVQNVPVEIRQGSCVRADEENCRHAIDQHAPSIAAQAAPGTTERPQRAPLIT